MCAPSTVAVKTGGSHRSCETPGMVARSASGKQRANSLVFGSNMGGLSSPLSNNVGTRTVLASSQKNDGQVGYPAPTGR